MRGKLAVTSNVQGRTCCVVVNIYFKALAVGVFSDLLLEHLNQLRDDKYQRGASQLVGGGPFDYDG